MKIGISNITKPFHIFQYFSFAPAAIFFITFSFLSLPSFSQDTIVKLNGQVIIAKVLEVSSTEIKYKKFDYLDGPDFVELTSKIEYITYKNGKKDVLNIKKREEDYTKPEGSYVNPHSPKIEIRSLKHRLSFSVNIHPLLINERSFFIDYSYKQRHSIGISVGEIYAHWYFKFYERSNYYPYSYNGIVTRLNYKYYYSQKRKQYFEFEFLYKNLSYSNKTFNEAKNSEYDYEFIRSETAYTLGIDILYGTHLISVEKRLNFEFFCGIGYRYMDRNYTTISCSYVSPGPHSTPYQPVPVGTFHQIINHPVITLGFKIGVNVFFKKKKQSN